MFVIGGCTDADASQAARAALEAYAVSVGRRIVEDGHDLLVCSPFEATADVAALRGWMTAVAAGAPRRRLEIHLPDLPIAVATLDALLDPFRALNLRPFRHPVPLLGDGRPNVEHAWLLAQLAALDNCQGVLAVGGRHAGTMNLLLGLAELRRVPVLPVGFLGGAAAAYLERRRFDLEDALADKAEALSGAPSDCLDMLTALVERRAGRAVTGGETPRFFVSYPRERSAEADHVETLLRRRNLVVFRDDGDFEVGRAIPAEIERHLLRADVFIALYCREFMLSPWCFDEMQTALERSREGLVRIALFCLDDTRMVPPGARSLIVYPCRSRTDLEARTLALVEQVRQGHR